MSKVFSNIIYTLTILTLLSCNNKEKIVDNNTDKTIKWIETHKKPIQVETFIYDKANRTYTLFSADNKVCNSGTVSLELPAIIEDSGSVKKYRDIIKEYQVREEYENDVIELQYELKKYLK